jgi:hypothetical protein
LHFNLIQKQILWEMLFKIQMVQSKMLIYSFKLFVENIRLQIVKLYFVVEVDKTEKVPPFCPKNVVLVV